MLDKTIEIDEESMLKLKMGLSMSADRLSSLANEIMDEENKSKEKDVANDKINVMEQSLFDFLESIFSLNEK